MTGPEKLTKYVIRDAMKELQHKKHYKTLEHLREELEKELADEGYLLDIDDSEKIRLIVNEEGYTGRFAIDDILLKKIKNKKYWPIMSIGAALVIFVVTSIAGALIEYFVQKPLENKGPNTAAPQSVIMAYFQLPDRIAGDKLTFTATIQNQLRDESLENLVLFAAAEESVKKINIETLPPGMEKRVNGNLDVNGVKKEYISFSAYIIGPKVSFTTSAPIMIPKTNMAAGSKPPGGSGSGVTSGPIAMTGKDKVAIANSPVTSGDSMDRVSVAGAKMESIPQMPMSQTSRKDEAVTENIEMMKRNSDTRKVRLEAVQSDKLVDDLIKIDNIEVLKTLAQMGNEKARKCLDERLHGQNPIK